MRDHSMTRGMADVMNERSRQQDEEGWSRAHDDSHDQGELVRAAACYVVPVCYVHLAASPEPMNGASWAAMEPPDAWPWDRSWWKPKDERRDLVRAAALIIAEIERLDRAEARKAEGAA